MKLWAVMIAIQALGQAPVRVDQFLESILKHCDQKISVETFVQAKRERRQNCKIKDSKCLSCTIETQRIVDANDFPLIDQSLTASDRKKLSCSLADLRENPKVYLEPELRNYRAQFAVLPILLFSLGTEPSVQVFHLKESKTKLGPKKLMAAKACPRLLKKNFKFQGRLDLSGELPSLRSETPAKLNYFIPMVPLEKVQRSTSARILLDEGSLDRAQLKDKDEVILEGQFEIQSSRKFAPELPEILEKNTFLIFKPRKVIRKDPL